MTDKETVYKLVQSIRKKHLPTGKEIIRETIQELQLDRISESAARENFNDALKKIFDLSLKVLERHEKEVYAGRVMPALTQLRASILKPELPLKTLDDVARVLQALYEDLWYVMQSRSQSRKGRGGADFQEAIAQMLRLAHIPFEQEEKPFRVDFYLPSAGFFEQKRDKAILLSAKRTLRERWREVVEELFNTKSPNVYIPTTDPSDLSKEKLNAIGEYNVHLLVWDEMKGQIGANNWVMGWSEFINTEVPSLRRHWPKSSPDG